MQYYTIPYTVKPCLMIPQHMIVLQSPHHMIVLQSPQHMIILQSPHHMNFQTHEEN